MSFIHQGAHGISLCQRDINDDNRSRSEITYGFWHFNLIRCLTRAARLLGGRFHHARMTSGLFCHFYDPVNF